MVRKFIGIEENWILSVTQSQEGLLNGFVEYREDLGMWTNNLIRYNNFERLCNVASNREIIGNVYQNRELLEVDDDRN